MLRPTRCVELSHGWSSRTYMYPPFNGHPIPGHWYNRTNVGFCGQRDRQSHACHEKWSDSSLAQFLAEDHGAIFAKYVQLNYQKSKGGYYGAELPHKILINKFFGKGTIFEYVSIFLKYSFAANHRDEITFLFFEVKQRLIWHFPGVVTFCQGSVHADLVLEDPSAEWKMEWLCNALQYSSSRGTKNASIIDSRPRTACDVNILLTYIYCFMCIVNFCLEWAITAFNTEIFIYVIKKQFQR